MEEKISYNDTEEDEETQVSKIIKEHNYLLDNMFYMPFRFIYNPSKITYMDAWSRSTDDMNTIADKLLLIGNNIKLIDNCVANISAIGNIDKTKKPAIIKGKCVTQNEKGLEIERYFTEIWFKNDQNFIHEASINLDSIREEISKYFYGSKKSIDEVYEEIKLQSQWVNEIDHTNYPAIDFLIAVPIQYGIDKIISFVHNYIENNLQFNYLDFIKLIDLEDVQNIQKDIIKNNSDNLISLMYKAQNFEGVALLTTSSCCLYNLENKEMLPLYRQLAILGCRVDLDKRFYIDKVKEYEESKIHVRYNSASVFKIIGYKSRGFKRWNYILAIDANINGVRSKPQIICNMCGYLLKDTNIDHHVNKRKEECIRCSQCLPYTPELIKERSEKIFGTRKYNLLGIKQEDIYQGVTSKIKIYCNDCKDFFLITIQCHITQRQGCKACSKNWWNLDRVLIEGPKVHNNRYSYHLIALFGVVIRGCITKIPVYCNTHKIFWWTTINSHFHSLSGCPACKCSKGELKCFDYLSSYKCFLELDQQYTIYKDPGGPNCNKKFDFKFIYNAKLFLLEFDGCQHFKFNTFFCKTLGKFIERQNIDIEKTQLAINHGYFLIRIDDEQLDNNTIETHIIAGINAAFNTSVKYYVSNPEKYKYITDKVSQN